MVTLSKPLFIEFEDMIIILKRLFLTYTERLILVLQRQLVTWEETMLVYNNSNYIMYEKRFGLILISSTCA